MTKLEVIFLGTSSATPTKTRSLPSIAIRRDGEVVLMDCGEGAQGRFVKFGLGLNREMVVLITHLHGDHVNGLLGLLQTMSMSQRIRNLTIVAPQRLFDWLKITMEILHVGLTFEMHFIPARAGLILSGSDYRIRMSRADHSIESWSYVFEENRRPGVFDSRKALALGVPEGKKWGALQHGRVVTVKGRKVRPHEVLGRPRAGRRVGYSGDTRPTKALARFFRGVDLLIFDSTFASKDVDKAVERKHSTATEAAILAKNTGAKRLVLTHFSSRYKNVNGLLKEARNIFPETVTAYDGLVIDVPRP